MATIARRKPPSRLRYEAEHPSLTVRLPAEVKAKVMALAGAEGLSVSEWVEAMAADPAARAADAHDAGRRQGEQVGSTAGLRAGLLAGMFAAQHGRSYSAAKLATQLVAHPEQRAIAERIMPPAFRGELADLLQSIEAAVPL